MTEKPNINANPPAAPTTELGGGGGITKELWTVLLDDSLGWRLTDIFTDTAEQAQAVIDQMVSLIPNDKEPFRWNMAGARIAKCTVTIYLSHGHPTTKKETI